MPTRDLPEFRRGQPPEAADLGETNAELARLAKLTVGPGLSLQDGPTGRHVAASVPKTIDAILSGAGSPYSWAEAYRTGGAWAAMPGGRAGTANAIEVNGVSGLAGKHAELRLCGMVTGNAEFCFQAIRRGVVTPTCVSTITVTVTDACAVGTPPLAGATVQITHATEPTQTGTTNASGVASFTVNAGGNWTRTVSKTGYIGWSATDNVPCNVTWPVTMSMTTTNSQVRITTRGCAAAALPGATVSAVQDGVTIGSGTTNGSGQITFNLISKSPVTFTSVASRYTTGVTTFNTPACGTLNSTTFTHSAATGYVCTNACGVIPLATTNLTLTDGKDGTVLPLVYLSGSVWRAERLINCPLSRDNTCSNPLTRSTRFIYQVDFGSIGSVFLSITCDTCLSIGLNEPRGNAFGPTTPNGSSFGSSAGYSCNPIAVSFPVNFVNSSYGAPRRYYDLNTTFTFTLTE